MFKKSLQTSSVLALIGFSLFSFSAKAMDTLENESTIETHTAFRPVLRSEGENSGEYNPAKRVENTPPAHHSAFGEQTDNEFSSSSNVESNIDSHTNSRELVESIDHNMDDQAHITSIPQEDFENLIPNNNIRRLTEGWKDTIYSIVNNKLGLIRNKNSFIIGTFLFASSAIYITSRLFNEGPYQNCTTTPGFICGSNTVCVNVTIFEIVFRSLNPF